MAVIPLASLQQKMEFEKLRDAISSVFVANEQGLYVTVDHQVQSWSADQLEGVLRTIHVFVQSMDPINASTPEFENDVTIGLFLRVSAPATGDKDAIENGTPAEKAAALAAVIPGAQNANVLWDELLRIATRIVMSPLNKDFGLADYTVSNRVMKQGRKDELLSHGNLVVVTGSAILTARVTEIMDGDTPVAGADPIIENKLNFRVPGDAGDSTPSKLEVDIPNPAPP